MATVPDYPVNLRLAGKRALVVGGGDVAEGRVCGLLVAQAQILVVSPEVTPALSRLAEEGHLELERRGFVESDLDGVTLVLGCTDDPVLNGQLAPLARARGIWVNIADDPPNCDFALPSIFRRGDILVAVSTTGRSPGFAAALRRRLEDHVDDADVAALEIIAEQRLRVREAIPAMGERFAAINTLVGADLPRVIRNRGAEEARRLAVEIIDQRLRQSA